MALPLAPGAQPRAEVEVVEDVGVKAEAEEEAAGAGRVPGAGGRPVGTSHGGGPGPVRGAHGRRWSGPGGGGTRPVPHGRGDGFAGWTPASLCGACMIKWEKAADWLLASGWAAPPPSGPRRLWRRVCPIRHRRTHRRRRRGPGAAGRPRGPGRRGSGARQGGRRRTRTTLRRGDWEVGGEGRWPWPGAVRRDSIPRRDTSAGIPMSVGRHGRGVSPSDPFRGAQP